MAYGLLKGDAFRPERFLPDESLGFFGVEYGVLSARDCFVGDFSTFILSLVKGAQKLSMAL